MIKSIFSVFFAPQGVFAPCGMFTAPHLVATAIAIIFSITAFLILKNRFNELRFRFLCRCFAIIVTALEITKIVHSFTNGYTNLDAWVPISYCSLFIYSLWMAGFGNGTLKDAGESFITCPNLLRIWRLPSAKTAVTLS